MAPPPVDDRENEGDFVLRSSGADAGHLAGGATTTAKGRKAHPHLKPHVGA